MSTKKEILILITFIYLFIFCARVLRVGGTIVLLLSEDHHRHLKGGEASSGINAHLPRALPTNEL